MEQRRTNTFMQDLLREGQRNAHLPILVGIALMLSGWFAAMTQVGAQFIFAGAGLVLLGMVLGRRLSLFIAGLVVLFFGLGGPILLVDQLT